MGVVFLWVVVRLAAVAAHFRSPGSVFRLPAAFVLAFAAVGAQADAITVRELPGSELAVVRDALVEAIETEGLVVGATLKFDDMLARTRLEREADSAPYRAAEIVQFCSSKIAWQLADEAAENLALCPMSIAIYVPRARPADVLLAWRSPGRGSAGRAAGDDLLRRLVERTAELSRLKW